MSDPDVPQKFTPQLSWRAALLGFVMALVLAAANAYLGLFAGLTVSASIPAAVVSMAILRWFRNVNALEHNTVQTIASSGEAIAAGAIFTLPALVLMHYWLDFPPGWVMLICGVGGALGVLFTIPLRHALIIEEKLPFPEGAATAVVIQAGERGGARALFIAAAAGGLAKLASGMRLWTESIAVAGSAGRSVFALGAGLSPALLGVGYIVGFNVAILVFAGGAFSWFVAIPLYAATQADVQAAKDAMELAGRLWSTRIRYLGVGAMLVGGLWALWSIRSALLLGLKRAATAAAAEHEKDLPRGVVFGVAALLGVPMFFLYLHAVGSAAIAAPLTIIMLLAGFMFAAVAGYMAGLVGSSNNPVSGVTIATILLTALGLLWFSGDAHLGPVAAVLVGAVVCCAAAMGGDNLQDLKAGALLGATPWKQQLAQFIGVAAGMMVLAPVLSLLLRAYGFGAPDAAHPHPLPAPQATLMAAVASGVFGGQLPWPMVAIGAALGAVVIAIDEWLRRSGSTFRAPVLAVAVGVYLPIELSVPIALGGVVARLAGQLEARGAGMLAAAGLITGEALMGIALAVPIVISGKADVLVMLENPPAWPGALMMVALCAWLFRLGRADSR